MRWLYLAAVLGLILWIGNMLIGPLLLFQGAGMVLGEPAVVATEFPATIRALAVKQGDRVSKGDLVGTVTSQQIAESMARLASDLADRRAHLAELRIRRQVVAATEGLATERARLSKSTRAELERLHERGLLPLDKRGLAMEDEYRSLRELEVLRAEGAATSGEIRGLEAAVAGAEAALVALTALFDGGSLSAPQDGIVGTLHASVGSVTKAGEPIVEIYGGTPYVLAYAPTGTLYTLRVGDDVQIRHGVRLLRGVIVRIEPVAAALPREFQGQLRPQDRAQLLRVEFESGTRAPPLFAKVTVSGGLDLPREWFDFARDAWDEAIGRVSALMAD